MCPFLHSGESDAMKSEMKERDTIPKPVGSSGSWLPTSALRRTDSLAEASKFSLSALA
jgi:hypothetical protein